MLHFVVTVQAYLTFQAGSTKTETEEKPCGLVRLTGRDYVGRGVFYGVSSFPSLEGEKNFFTYFTPILDLTPR